ncbi:hypothetical protein I7X12_08120 [Halosimplex litoreum]|uniref:Uncharacterized protein n=1 Tax=Halosimplex litoreum TaxID=1198301 RepID=A0A7U3WAC2_9EURY|nr:hypothetical protein [Halosimplex litoreum]QPV64567.1 hypothetical protein I7X12_08120 [Halosimplex litoreum]
MPDRGNSGRDPDGDGEPDSSFPLRTASAGRNEWSNTTPTDAGEALLGSLDSDEEA